MQAPWRWHDSVGTCRSVVIYKFIVIVLMLVNLQNSKKMHGTCIGMFLSIYIVSYIVTSSYFFYSSIFIM